MRLIDRSTTLSMPPEGPPLKRFTVDEYHRMLEASVFEECDSFELLEGWIVEKKRHTPLQDYAINGFLHWLIRNLPEQDWCCRSRSSVTTLDSEPEPDVAIVRAPLRRYKSRHPGPADLALVVEATDATLDDDRKWKGRIYARAAVPVYWIVNVVDRQIEVYTDPTGPCDEPEYRDRRDYGETETLPVVLDGQHFADLSVRRFFP